LCGMLIVGESGDIDHIVEKAKGGTDSLSNLRLLHKACHSKRTARDSS
jgi:5-methylcytosine-specific restriction endonuclease McrA